MLVGVNERAGFLGLALSRPGSGERGSQHLDGDEQVEQDVDDDQIGQQARPPVQRPAEQQRERQEHEPAAHDEPPVEDKGQRNMLQRQKPRTQQHRQGRAAGY